MRLIKNGIPPGTLIPFGGGDVPSGYLRCDGSTVSRTIYSALFAAIGVAHGSGDGSTTFHLPDLRGRFLRGVDNMGTGAAGRDSDAATRTASNAGGASGSNVGSVQADSMQGHYHQDYVEFKGAGRYSSGAYSMFTDSPSSNASAGAGKIVRQASTDGTNGTPRISAESRPQNAAVLYIIKA